MPTAKLPADEKIDASLTRLLRTLGSDKSRRAYTDDWARYVAWLKTQGVGVLEVKPRHVEDHIIHLQGEGCERSTCSRALSVLRSVYGRLVLDELVQANPAREVKTPKFDSEPNTPRLNEEQVRAMLALPATTWLERRDQICIQFMLAMGWRRSEVAVLRADDIEGVSAEGRRKGGKRRVTGIPEFLLEKLRAWCKYAGIEDGPVFPRSPDNPSAISGDIVYQIVKRALVRAGIDRGSPHALRRTFATILYERGTSLKELQVALSHNSITTTERYAKNVDAAKNAPGKGLEDLFGDKDEEKETE